MFRAAGYEVDDFVLFHFPFFSPFSDMYTVLASHDAP